MKPVHALITFILVALTAALLCTVTGNSSFLAPLLASAAVLAGAGDSNNSALTAMLVANAICLITGSLAILFLAPTTLMVVLVCALAYLLCLLLKQTHPPALALLAVLLMQTPDLVHSMYLLVSVLMMALIAALTAVLSRRLRTFTLLKPGVAP